MERKLADRAKKGCNRCGSQDVAWHQSERGKWYLIEVFTDPRDGASVANYRDFHSTYCGKPELHNQEQERITLAHQEQEEARAEKARIAEDMRIAKEARMMQDFIDLSHQERTDFIAKLQARYDAEARNPATMDYMVEYGQFVTMMEGLRTEIDFYTELQNDLAED